MRIRIVKDSGRMLFAILAVVCGGSACSAASPDDGMELGADESTSTAWEGVSGSLAVGTTLQTTGNLNLRSGPSAGYKVLLVMPKGSTATTAERTTPSGRYYKIEHDGTLGWAHGNYLRVVPGEPEPGGSGGSSEPPDPSICDGFDTGSLLKPSVCDGPGGSTSKAIPSNGLYAASWFGCYRKSNGSTYKDPYDNCVFACGPQGYCPSWQSGPECQAELMWFAADADRYGCGGLIRVTNCHTGRSVVLVALDRGPNCKYVEKANSAPVLDMSHPAMEYLFDGGIYGGSDHQRVVVEKVAQGTPLGPVQ